MVNNQLADSISHSGALGLAKSVESQMVRQAGPKPAEHGLTAAPLVVNPKHH